MTRNEKNRLLFNSFSNSYTQIFFSDNKVFALILFLVTFIDIYAGLAGLIAVLITNFTAIGLGFSLKNISQGLYGFNSLLVGIGIGIYFEFSGLMLFIVLLAAILTLFVALLLEGVIGKYQIPFLSIPFVLVMWTLTIASKQFEMLGISQRGIYSLNELYALGGTPLINIYEWWNTVAIPASLKTYFLSFAAILFQYNVLSGILIALGLLLFSRIAFMLSLIGFYTAYYFYQVIGVSISDIQYTYIGFNYILTSIAIGGFFIIPKRNSILWTIILIPLVAIITISLSKIVSIFGLPIYSLPFNIIVLMFIYILKFRVSNFEALPLTPVQHNSPEKNLYIYENYKHRFKQKYYINIRLPFFGDWVITQGHNGKYTHKGAWRYAWDFEIKNQDDKTYKDSGNYREDYFCYNKWIIAPASGYVVEIIDGIEDNTIGQRNLKQNWGNTIVLKHAEGLYSKLSHLKPQSVEIKKGDYVKQGQNLAKCGNSGNSPYPHLHFQFQATPYIGSQTLKYPFFSYILKAQNQTLLQTNEYPNENETVSNIKTAKALQNAFCFIAGQKFTLEPKTKTNLKNEEWEVITDIYGNTYIQSNPTQSKIYLKTDEDVIYFDYFEGKKRTILYFFYLAAYKTQTGLYPKLTIKDYFPINQIYNPFILFFQDFMAPFYIFLKAEYQFEFEKIEDDFTGSEIIVKSKVVQKYLTKVKEIANFQFNIDEKGIKYFIINNNKKQQIKIKFSPKNNSF